MSVVTFEDKLTIPEGVTDHASFRAWARSDQFPEKGRISWLAGEIWIDLSPESLFAHNRVKGGICATLDLLARKNRLGYFFHDRTLLSHEAAGLSTEPDGLFIAYDSVRSGRVRWVKGVEAEIEVEGTPDMVLEVISKSSRRKDAKTLRKLYWDAGIPEYWLVDALSGEARLEILQRSESGYAPIRSDAEWLRSPVFGRAFRLLTRQDELGYPEYDLVIREG